MGKGAFQTNPFLDIALTQADREELLALERRLVEETFHMYEHHVVVDNFQVDTTRWKHLRTDKNLRVYVERSKWVDESEDEAPTSDSTGTNDLNKLPRLLCAGSFQGSLNDLMFGTVNPTQDIMRVKASYVKDYDDGAVLANIIVPTAEDPFRSVTVKWTKIDLPLGKTGLIKNRDFVCLEATGILHFANGDQVGYQLLHSIEFNQTDPLPGTVRARHIITGFYRQSGPNVIDTFAFDTVDPGGNVARKVALSVSAKALVSTNNYVICGQMKKLNWRLQHRQAELRLRRHRSSTREGSNPNECVACKHTLSPGYLGIPAVRSLGKSTCKLCMNPVCHSCKIVEPISFLTPDGKLLSRKITFCRLCICEVTAMDAIAAARDQAEGYDAYNVMQSLSGSDTVSDDLNE